MALLFIVLAAVVLVAIGVYAIYGRRPAGDDVDRFHHARQLTSGWSRQYDGAPVQERPEVDADA